MVGKRSVAQVWALMLESVRNLEVIKSRPYLLSEIQEVQ